MNLGEFGMEFASVTNAHRSISVCQTVKSIVQTFVLEHFILFFTSISVAKEG